MPSPDRVRDLLLWHQGALGDLLLAGPALMAIRDHYPQARITAVGHPERWGLLADTLELAGVWDGNEAVWAYLFTESRPPERLRTRLASFQFALYFSPRPNSDLGAGLRRGGVGQVGWLPAFPEDGQESVAAYQARHLAGLGVTMEPRPFRLVLKGDPQESGIPPLPEGRLAAVAPGSGHAVKNWPLAHYYELTRALAWERQVKILWLAGPAETALLPYLAGIAAAQGHTLVSGLNLRQMAGVLSRCRLYIGNDGGLTHLAAAAGAGAVLALFGPTDPRIWAPWGEQVRVLQAPCNEATCAREREIAGFDSRRLRDLAPEEVLAAAAALLDAG